MPRKEATTNLDVLGLLDMQPLKTVGEYLTSKENEKLFMKPPVFDTPGDEIESFYILNKFEHETSLNQLEELRKHKKLQECIFEQRTRKVQQNHNKLHQRFVRVNNFIRDSDEKRKAAFKKINEEIERHKELSDIIEKKKEMVEDLKKFRVEFKTNCDEYKTYETVLDNVVKRSTFFPSVKELINRCDAIMMAQGEIVIMNTAKFQDIETMHKRIVDIIKQAELVYLGLMNELTQMERSYQQARNECLYYERILVTAKDAVITARLKKERVRDAMYLLYRTLCKRLGQIPLLYRSNIESQADFILDEVEVLRELVEECSKRFGT